MTRPTVVAVGNTLIDHTYHLTNLPDADGGAFVREYERCLGGVSTNVATMLARLGHDTGVISCVADDEDGAEALARLEDSPVAHSSIHRVEGARTSYCLVLTDPEGQRAIIGGGESVLQLSLTEENVSTVAAAEAAFTSAYAPLAAARTVAGLDTPLVYDLAGEFTDLTDRGLTRDALDDLAPDVDLFVANQSSVRSYLRTDASAEECRRELIRRGFSAGAITRGSDAVHLFDGDRTCEVPAFDVPVTDTTGAGDAFTAGLIHARMLADLDLRAVGRFAHAVAALNCTSTGAHTGSPTLSEVEAFLE